MPNPDLSEVGNHFFLGLQPTTTLHDKDKYLLNALKPAGVILFKSNFSHCVDYEEWLESHKRLIKDVREAVGRDKVFIAIDHEGARVCRTPHPVTRFKSAVEWARKSQDVGAAMGRELASLGINMNFAPVMDIHTNPENPVIGSRAFGSSADVVSQSGLAFMKGIQGENVWACAKHFPGHGDTDVDSHYDLPVLYLSVEQILERELIPFKAAIDRGIEIIMTGHILFPEIDPDLPATLSKTITNGILRKTLGYEGVVVSDDIGMHAMNSFFQKPETAVQFLEAGNDILMACAHFTDTQRVTALATAMLDALKNPSFRKKAHEPSFERVEKMLDKTTMHDVKELPVEQFEQHAALDGTYDAKTVEVV